MKILNDANIKNRNTHANETHEHTHTHHIQRVPTCAAAVIQRRQCGGALSRPTPRPVWPGTRRTPPPATRAHKIYMSTCSELVYSCAALMASSKLVLVASPSASLSLSLLCVSSALRASRAIRSTPLHRMPPQPPIRLSSLAPAPRSQQQRRRPGRPRRRPRACSTSR